MSQRTPFICWWGSKVCLCHYSYYYRYFSNWTSFKIDLMRAHLKFYYKLLLCSAAATIPESKYSSSTFPSYPILLCQCMMPKTYMLFLVRQSFMMPLNYTNFFFNLLSVLIVQLQEKTIWWNITEYNISEICIRVTRP